MNGRFRDRIEAGQMLAPLLGGYARRDDVVVLAVPRGGVEIGFEIACRLHAPLGVLLVREIPAPDLGDVAMGVVVEGGVTTRDEDRIRMLAVTPAQFAAAASFERAELARQARKFLPHEAEPDLTDKIVILAVDGIATAELLRPALAAVRSRRARTVLVAAPVAALAAVEALRADGCETVALLVPEEGCIVSEFYGEFSPPSDDEIVALLERANVRRAAPTATLRSP